MSFGKTIKELRRRADMTQEQLAELLSISPQAVSRWETDAAMPDISLLPALTAIFDITADELLGIDSARRKEKIAEILAEAERLCCTGDFAGSLACLRAGYAQYPRAYAIMERLADAIVNVNARRGSKDYDEAIDLCHRVLDGSTDNLCRYRALDTLVTALGYAGRTDEMRAAAEQLPPFAFCRERAMLWRDNFNETGLARRKEYLAALIEQLLTALTLIASHYRVDGGGYLYPEEDRIALFEQIVGITELLYPDGDYQLKAQDAEEACRGLVRIYLQRGDTAAALDWLEREVQFITHFDTYDFDAPHTSPALRGFADGGWIPEDGEGRSDMTLRDLREDSLYDPLRAEPRFAALLESLRKTAKKA